MGKPRIFFEELERHEERYWSITGLFSRPIGIFHFGGFFFENTPTGGEIIYGQLIDSRGISNIVGTITQNELKFDKKYVASGEISERSYYEFKKEGEIFVGGYKLIGTGYRKGNAKCIITPLTKLEMKLKE